MTIHGFIARNNAWAYLRWETLVLLLIVNLSICLFIDDIKKLKAFITVFITIHVLSAGSRILSMGFFGSSGTVGDTNDFALAMNVVIPISFYIGVTHQGIRRFPFWLATTLFVMANVFTMSRGGFVALASVALFCWLKAKAKITGLLLLVIVSAAFFTFIPQDYKTELLTLKEERLERGTGRDRIEMWKIVWRIFLSHPVMGVGPGNMVFILGDYQDEEQTALWGRSLTGRQIHSIYFDTLGELGIIGIIIMGTMTYNLFRKYRSVTNKDFLADQISSIKAHDQLFLDYTMQGLFAGLVGYLVGGIFLSAFYYPHFWNLAALITTVYMLKLKMNERHELT